MKRYGGVVPLASYHDTAEFDCGSSAQTVWLREIALQAQRSDTSRVYVVCRHGGDRVVGYYALASGSVELDAAPARVAKGTGRYPIPVVLLTRLGVDLEEQRQGLGKALAVDALKRVAAASETIGARTLLIHAESEDARAFYVRLAEFEPSPTDPLHLYLLMKDLRGSITK